MTDVVWVALISASGAVVAALTAQLLATRASSRSADRAEQREALQWQRSEASRLSELARADAQRNRTLHEARLRELWAHVLVARWQMLDALERLPVQGHPTQVPADVSAAEMPANAAGQAYAVALLGLAGVRPQAKAFYVATSDLQLAMQAADEERIKGSVSRWRDAFKVLEESVSARADTTGMDT